MKRIEALAIIDEVFSGDPVVVTCGATSRELASVRTADNHLYLLDSMGLSASVGLGLAICTERPVAAIEGDGSLLMGLSALASIAYHRPPNLTLIVLDNHIHASAKSFPTQSSRIVLADLCRGAGLRAHHIDDPEQLKEILVESRSAETGPTALVVEIEPQNESRVPFLLMDPVGIKLAFQNFLEEGR
ncbi:MAG: thiamine pyrophosphate-dependent enzyme [Actinomycetota bacterium]|nr:thiamine pyrophosphate-dependent enzyme [Actinomycetota bacterium]